MRRNEDRHFGESVHNDQDGVVADTRRETLDEVHGEGAPWPFRDGEETEGAERFVADGLGASTVGTGLDEVGYEFVEARPVEASFD